MNSSQIENKYLAAFNNHWGWFLVWGIALVILGVIAIGATTMTTLVTVMLLGILLLISGGVILIDTFTFWWGKGGGFFLHLVFGILYLVVGIMLLQQPLVASISLTLLLGIFYLVIGVFRLISSVALRTPRWGWNLFNAIISILLGILILTNWPQSGLFIIGLFIGIDLLFTGWAYIMASLAARSLIK